MYFSKVIDIDISDIVFVITVGRGYRN